MCVDEMTGVQAKERIAPTKPMRPGQTEKVEFEYKRHGTQCLIGNFEVATGQANHLPSSDQGALTCMAPEAVRAENSGRYMSSTLAAGCA